MDFTNKKNIFIGIGAVLILITGAFFFTRTDPIEKKFKELESRTLTATKLNEDILDDSKYRTGPEGRIVYDGDLTPEQMALILRRKYGSKIENAGVQISMLEKLMRDLKAKFGDRWIEVLQEILGMAFPGLETKLFRMSESLYKYEKYVEKNRNRLTGMSDADRQKEIWKVRRELFGDSAEEMWAAEKKQSAVNEVLKQIQDNKSVPVKEKITQYSTGLKEIYGKEFSSQLENKRQTFMESFLRVVQDDLSSMSPTERKETLNEVRKGMGMDSFALKRWEALDSVRDERWDNGEKYKAERLDIISKFSGNEQERKLDDIRKKYYGAEAESVKNEEASGYFRYEQKRQYGID
ncbi:MAG: hypothetical protein K8R21_02970 [Leptospira sp.]|nr:hypothetical protein [Leptospira sp.]